VLVLHIGYAKAATTFLQRQVFPHLPGVNYIGRCYGENVPDSRKAEWVYDFVFRDDVSVSATAAAIRDSGAGDGAVNLVSHEALLRPFATARCQNRLKAFNDNRLKALATHFATVRVIVSIRKQTDIILSRRVHDRGIIAGGTMADVLDFEGATACRWPQCSREKKGFTLFRSSRCACRKAGLKFINVPFYNYLALYDSLTDTFGAAQVHCMVSEALAHDPEQELARLTDFLGTQRMDSALAASMSGSSDNARRGQPLYEETQREYTASGKEREVFGYFLESNRVLAQRLGRDLSEYGYY